MQENGFLEQLLTLQQDGSGAISAPSNWKCTPLLEVETQTDKTVASLYDALLATQDGANRQGQWHFFVGSPGNGKSAAVGKLVRKLLDSGHTIHTKKGVLIHDLRERDIPYVLEICQPEKNYAFAWIAQDASVLDDPFSADLSPSSQLVDLMRSALSKGVSLIVCTNRGVIENAYSQTYLDRDSNHTQWFRVLKAIVEGNGNIEITADGVSKRQVFDTLHVEYTELDDRSLVIGNDILARLITRATQSDHWDCCGSCDSKQRCPFIANRDWLATEHGRLGLVHVLRRAEVLSGQIIAFREALALISFLLAGCPRDYRDLTPCQWVEKMVGEHNLFALLSRRVYMSLFAAYAPVGLEHDEELRKTQVNALSKLMTGEPMGITAIRSLQQSFDSRFWPSTDVGVTRLLGPNGILRSLDPLLITMEPSKFEEWTFDVDRSMSPEDQALISSLDRECMTIWRMCEEKIESSADQAVEQFFWLERWKSAFAIRLGALLQGYTSFSAELDELIELIELQDERHLSDEHLRRLRRLEEQLDSLLNCASEHGITLSEFVSLNGEWVHQNLKPRVVQQPRMRTLGLVIRFGKDEEILLSAEVYLWLRRRDQFTMSTKTFPTGLLESARSMQINAAARSSYSRQLKDVTLNIQMPDRNATLKLSRYQGKVLLDIK